MFIFMGKFFGCLRFFSSHLFLIIFSGLFKDMLDFRHRNNREKFREKEVAGEKKSEGTHIKSYLIYRR